MKGTLTVNEPERDIQRLWRDPPREEHAMSIDDIRSKAERFERKVRRWNLVGGVAFVLVIVAEALEVWIHPNLLQRVGDVLSSAALLYVIYRFRPYAAVQAMPAGLGLTSSVDFYRKQLVRQCDLAGNPWRYLLLFIPGMGLILLGRALERPPAQTAAIAAFGVALFLGVVWLERRTARQLQREIDELGE
jgi:hypothetical protein